MNDLVRVLRGQRIDGRGADEIMRRAADEIDRLRVIEQTEAAMRRRLEEAVADCERLRERVVEAEALLKQMTAWRVAIECVAPELGGVSMTLARIDAHLSRKKP
jgi:hypothetical protein